MFEQVRMPWGMQAAHLAGERKRVSSDSAGTQSRVTAHCPVSLLRSSVGGEAWAPPGSLSLCKTTPATHLARAGRSLLMAHRQEAGDHFLQVLPARQAAPPQSSVETELLDLQFYSSMPNLLAVLPVSVKDNSIFSVNNGCWQTQMAMFRDEAPVFLPCKRCLLQGEEAGRLFPAKLPQHSQDEHMGHNAARSLGVT
ncbi:hypothetical protein H920_12732 [Fukomys damarensis]|uniref:Uncharacterized protein n=1 Tax=Fukomys damarensis TaxID=885580 RepID=A0A091D133_FUKDA|nr:hypothetical protein H920_12732 [Fukomys damarensis]